MNVNTINLIFFLTVLLIGSLLYSCSLSSKPYSRELSKINSKTCDDLNQLYGMNCIGRGLGLDKSNEKVATIYIRFSMKKSVHIDEARIIALDALKIMMKNVNQNEVFLQKHATSNFDESNIDLWILFTSPDGETVLDPFIEAITIIDSNIDYTTNDPVNPKRYKSKITETLEEARQKVSN